MGRATAEMIDYLKRPLWIVRIAGIALGAGMIAIAVAVSTLLLRRQPADFGWVELLQAVESGINDVVFIGIALYFLGTLENRIKRRRALEALHQLRSVAHIVDMHQLTKDPERLLNPQPDTASSPRRSMTPAQLGRYLDYCSELLSLTAKLAALHVQHFSDPIVLGAVTEIETLTGNLSNKIWQKITLLERAPA